MWDYIINIRSSELSSTKIKESRINESEKKSVSQYNNNNKIWTIYILYLIISLQFFLKS